MPTIDNGSTPRIPLYCVLASDHLTPATGKTVAVTISKNGAGFGNPSGGATNATEIGSGWYYVDLSATDSGTNGPLIVLATNADCDNATIAYTVVAAGGTAPTAAQVATAVWQDTTSGDFTVSSSIGKCLYTSGNAPGTAGGLLKIGTSPLPATGTLASAVWNEVNTGATHNVNASTGKQLRTIALNTGVIYTGTAPSQAGMTTTGIKLDAGASATDQIYQWDVISLIDGTGAGQSAIIISYNGITKVATVDSPWTVQPDNTSVFEITPTAQVRVISYETGQDPATLVWNASTRTLTSLPAITSNWITAAGIAAGALNGKGDWSTYAGGDTSGVTTLLSRIGSAITISSGGVIVAGYASAQDPASQVLNATAASYNTPNSIGSAINDISSIGDPLASTVPGSYTSGTAGYVLGTYLDASISSRSTYAGGAVASVTGNVKLDLTQVVPTSNTAQTVGDALNAARAVGFGKWVVDVGAKTLTLYASDGSTAVRTFNLDNPNAPLTRT